MAITKILNIQSVDNRNPTRHLEQALEYIQNSEKTNENVLVGSLNCLPETAFAQMMETKQIYGKTDKRQGYHFIISFVPDEATKEQAFDIMREFAEEFLGDNYEAVFSVHTDKNHMHGHLIFNSVSIATGAKYDYRKGDWKRKIQPITNKLCEKYNLSIQPAEYAKHPVNLSRKEWQYEQTFKEMMLKDAMFCLSYAGNLEHFQFLMRRLGYEFKDGSYLTVRMPGRKLYHQLDKMDEVFSKNLIKYSFEGVGNSLPIYVTSNPIWSRKNNMSPFQNKYYGKMYRLRMIEQKRFIVGSVNYAKDLVKFHDLQERYLFIVKNDIRDMDALLTLQNEATNKIKEITKEQDFIYRQNSIKKRSCKTEEQWRDYQKWHMNEYAKLDILKAAKKEAKDKLKIIEGCVSEQLDTAKDVVSEYEEINVDSSVEVPEYVAVGVRDDVFDDGRVGGDHCTRNTGKTEIEVDVAAVRSVEPLPTNYEEYSLLSVKEKVKRFGIESGIDVFDMVQAYFKSIGYKASFGETYDESCLLEKGAREVETDEKAVAIADSILASGINYSDMMASDKAILISFKDGDNNYNLSLYTAVMKKLGNETSAEERYEDYQKIYDEKMRCGNGNWRNEEEICNRKR